MDMTETIAPKSDQISADTLMTGPMTITVKRVAANEGNAEQPINVAYEGEDRLVFRPCKQMRRVMVAAWGADASRYVGRSLTLYRDPDVMFGGMKVGGVRISHMSHIDRDLTVPLTASKAQRRPFTVKRLDSGGPPRPQETRRPEAEPPALSPDLRERALLAARQGTVTFTAFWQQADVKPHRPALQSILAECQGLAKEADAKGAPTELDPFSGGDDAPASEP